MSSRSQPTATSPSPVFIFDSQERWFPVGIEESLEACDATLPAGFPDDGGEHDRIDFPPTMEPPPLPPVVYLEEIAEEGLLWRRYWLWYPYNPKRYAGFGEHEGDWELVQLGCCGERAILMTVSRHGNAGKCELFNRSKLQFRGPQPVVFVALGSHAHYFRRGQIATDRCDGKGRVLDSYELRKPGPWWDWPGRWGNSTGKGQSPQSPGCQRRSPGYFHARAK